MNSQAIAGAQARSTSPSSAGFAFSVMLVSFAYALLLVFSPAAFPRVVTAMFVNGYLFPGIAALAIVSNEEHLYAVGTTFSVSRILDAAYLGLLTACNVGVFYFFARAAVPAKDILLTKNAVEELLAYTYFSLITALFVPYLLFRLSLFLIDRVPVPALARRNS